MSSVTRSSISSGKRMVCTGRGFLFGRLDIITWLWIVCALATLAVSQQQNPFYTHGRYGKREDSYAQASPFFSGSRYGRSGVKSSREPKSESKMLEVSPRVDRFFLGSRYGKRGFSINENNNDKINDQRLEQSSRISSIRRFEKALGYLDREQRGDRNLHPRENYSERNGVNGEKRNYGEIMPINIPNENELDNFW